MNDPERESHGRGAARLASLAGLSARPSVEVLEPRQMLFSLTITPSDVTDPTTGVGQTRAVFGYILPGLFTDQTLGDAEFLEVDEPLDDEIPPDPRPNPQNVPSGVIFTGSNIRLLHNIIPGNNIQIRNNPPPAPDAADRFMRVRLDAGQFFALQPLNAAGERLAATEMAFTITSVPPSNVGLNAATMTVQLFYRGQLVRSLTGAELLAANPNGTGVGTFTFTTDDPFNRAFDELRLVANSGSSDPFDLDDIHVELPQGLFADIINNSIYGTEIVFAGQVGATLQVFDLLGNDMDETIVLGRLDGSPVTYVDLNDDGIPDFNYGIGKIVISNGDSSTAMTMFGGLITRAIPDPDTDFAEGGFIYKRVEALNGLYNRMEAGGFGFDIDVANDFVVHGLPPGAGSVVIGAPSALVRDPLSVGFTPEGTPTEFDPNFGFIPITVPITEGFNRTDQGIFVTGGRSIAGVYIHGMLFGSSQFSGAVERIVVSNLMGSITVNGDLGALIVSGDAGMWQRDDGSDPHNNVGVRVGGSRPAPFVVGLPTPLKDISTTGIAKSQAQLVVGRTVGEIAIGARSLLDVTVVGDINNPLSRPPRDVAKYYEKEYTFAINPAASEVEDTIRLNLFNTDFATTPNARAARTNDQAPLFANEYYRNDTYMGAEWVGSMATGVRIFGDLSARDPVNTGDDQSDVYAFASDGRTPISVQMDDTGFYFRIVDSNGRTVAAPSGTRVFGRSQFNFVQYTPTSPGIYYVVITDPAADDADFGFDNYAFTLLGMAPVTLGAYRTGASSGTNDTTVTGKELNNTVTLLSGNAGSLRIGTARVTGAGGEASSAPVTNSTADGDDLGQWLGGTFSVPGNLFNITTGSDVAGTITRPVTIQVGGDFGTLYTGRSAVAGLGAGEGDLNFFSLSVGGRIAEIRVSGGAGIDADTPLPSVLGAASGQTRILSGRSGGNGDIGMIRFGSHVANDALVIETSKNSVVGALLVSQDVAMEDTNPFKGIFASAQGVNFNLGQGSDLRFADFPQIDQRASVDVSFFLIGGQTLPAFVDDGGGLVTIRVVGAPAGALVGRVLVLPVNGSQGVAIGRIEANLAGGAVLEITSSGPTVNSDVISIGQIVITGASGNSGININGNVQTDVWRITTRAPISFIRNTTSRGDIVAIDANGLNNLFISNGNLGRTEVVPWGPRTLGVFAGVAAGGGGGGNTNADTRPAAFTIPPAGNGLMDPDWNGQMYRPANTANLDAGQAFLDDVGSPLDPYLDGLVVRNGGVNSVSVSGAVGDVIVPQGRIVRLAANDDQNPTPGGFDGIVGNVYAADITLVDIGDGLAARDQAPMLTTGIIATNDIIDVVSNNSPNANIRSVITAANANAADLTGVNGIDSIDLTGGGDYIDAYVSVSNLDAFWFSFNYGDALVSRGTLNFLGGTDADLFRSEIFGGDVVTIALTNGFWDATFASFTQEIGTVTAKGFRNSTLTGGNLEFHANVIQGAKNLVTLTTEGQEGDINDFILDLNGSVTGEVSARSMNRVQLEVDNTITLLRVTTDLRASQVNAGQLTSLTAGRNVTASKITIAGPILEIRAGNAIVNSEIAATGAFGRIELITANEQISGKISSSGPIGTVHSVNGDLRGEIVTITSRGDVGSLIAGRDLDIKTDISGTLNRLEAGRHIGNRALPGVIVVRGNLESATAGGQLYSDIRVGQVITGVVTIGQVSALPGANQLGSGSIYSFGSINAVEITGDFNGNIISYSGGINTVTIINGSFLPGNTITAFDGSINSVIVRAGNLYGNIHADQIVYLVQVESDASGVFGDIGVNPAFNSNMAYDQFRNAMPVGVAAGPAIQGPRITAGWNVGIVYVTNGSMFETSIIAGRAIGIVFVAGSAAEGNGNVGKDQFTNALANVFAAGDQIYLISVQGDFTYAYVLAGVVDLGSDGTPGGTGLAHDTVKSGSLNWLYVAGATFATVATAGADSGSDGVYATGDDTIVPGISWINNITLVGGAAGIFAIANAFTGAIDGRVVQVGTTLPLQDPQIDPGTTIPGPTVPAGPGGAPGAGLAFNHLGASGVIYFVGPGQAFWDAVGGRVVLRNTTVDSYLTVSVNSPPLSAGSPGTLTSFDIVTNDDASVGGISIGTVLNGAFVAANLAGDSDIVIDGFLNSLTVGRISGTGSIKVGENLGTFFSGTFSGGTLSAKYTYVVVIDGDYGAADPFVRDEVKMDLMFVTGGVLITGSNRGAINIDRDLPSMTVFGAMDGATLRAGTTIGGLSVGSMARTWISARDYFGTLTVGGDMFDSSLMIGADLGTDTEFGGVGLAADTVTTGVHVGSIVIGGDFRESDIVAGAIRGPDGFFGTSDDSLSEGRSSILSVTIGGDEVGSDRNSETYRISSTGFLGPVTINGAPAGRIGNFSAQADVLPPLPFQVSDLQVTQDSRIFTARIFFNQPVNASSLPSALTVSEVRGSGEVEILLVNGVDYTLTYDADENAAVVEFKRAVTDRDLPQESGVPGPGVYRFRLDQNLARAQLINTRLDGNRDGRSPVNDNYSADDFVGDAGDKLEPNVVDVIDPNTGEFAHRVDFYGPADLNIILDDNRMPDGLPDPNKVFTIRGSIGDHPDNDTNYFRFGDDTDVYKVTLQAGQILHIGRVTGPASLIPVNLFDADGNFVSLSGEGAQATFLPVNPGTFSDITSEQAFLIKTTGTYYIVASNSPVSFTDPNNIANLDLVPGTIGDYAFDIEIFDDGNSGFSATTDAGNGMTIATPPAPGAFAGPDGLFDTGDDLAHITVGQFVYVFSRGADGVPNTADDAVTGNDFSGRIVSARDGTGLIGTVVDSAIGPTGHFGVPGFVYSDVDIYHLNSRLPIATGTRIKITVRLTDIGADLGSRSQRNLLDPISAATLFQDFRGSVQFGVFDTSNSVNTEDAVLVFSPTDFKPNGGEPGNVTSGDNATYGYDENGDFFIEFTAPGRQGAPGLAATYAVYLQGVFNTDYRLEIVQSPFNPSITPAVKSQNIFLETRGGSIDWLEAGGLTTTLRGFEAAQLGFNGAVQNGQPVQTYIINQVRSQLQAMYNAAGYDVNISTNPSDFEFEEFSTIYLSASSDPTALVLSPVNVLFGFAFNTVPTSQPHGYSEHSDPLNADRGDDAVVFTPGMALLGYTPTQADVDLFTQSLTAAVGRRIGELMGLRITANYDIDDTELDVQAANSVSQPPGPCRTYAVSGVSRLLSDSFDEIERTDFYLGRQNAVSLLDQYLAHQ